MEKMNIQPETHNLRSLPVMRTGAADGGIVLCFLRKLHAFACILKYIQQIISQLQKMKAQKTFLPRPPFSIGALWKIRLLWAVYTCFGMAPGDCPPKAENDEWCDTP